MSDYSDFLERKKELLTSEIIENIEYNYPIVIDRFKLRQFDIIEALTIERKKELLLELEKGISEINRSLYPFYKEPNNNYIYNGYDGTLIYVHFYFLYKNEYDKLNVELSGISNIIKSNSINDSFNKAIFKNKYTSLLFDYFEEHYYNENKSKYVQIYRFLQDNIICSQEKYRDFIKDRFEIKISKITDENYNCQLILREREIEFKKVYLLDLE